jgi:hypothetical protein
MDDPQAAPRACAHCGAPLAGGRFCTNCGARIGTLPSTAQTWPDSTDTAERRYDLSQPPRHVSAARPAAPLRANPSHAAAATPRRVLPPPPPSMAPSAPPPAAPPTAPPAPEYGRPNPGVGLWIGAGAALLAVLLLGGFLLFHGSGGGGSADSGPPPLIPRTHPTAATKPTDSPSARATSAPPSPVGPATNVAGLARVSAPGHAPAGVDFAGQPVTYDASNLVDGRFDTAWRMPGNATGEVITFRLDQPTKLSRVGLVNGYSKIAYDGGRRFDWYLGNRRVLAVDWIFDNGLTVSQHFGNSRTMQQKAIKPVTTRDVRLKITAVSPPGRGPAARNDTAISEVLLIGRGT